MVPSSAVAVIFKSWGKISDLPANEWYLITSNGLGISLKIVSWSWTILASLLWFLYEKNSQICDHTEIISVMR